MTEQLRIIDQLLGNLHEDEQIVFSIDRSTGPSMLKIERFNERSENDNSNEFFDRSVRLISQMELTHGLTPPEHVVASALLETAVEVRAAKDEAEMKEAGKVVKK